MAVAKKSKKKRSPIASITADELIRELPSARAVRFAAGRAIFREGSKAESCYLITQGSVQILKKTKKGDSVFLATVKTGEFLGEMAMLSGENRSASAIALTNLKAIIIQRAEFVALLKAQHPFAGRLALQLSNLLAVRCHRLLRLIARQPEVIPLGGKKPTPPDVRAVLNRVYTLWAV